MYNKKIKRFLKSYHPKLLAKVETKKEIPFFIHRRVFRNIPGYPSLHFSVSKELEIKKPSGMKIFCVSIWTYDDVAKKGLFNSDDSKCWGWFLYFPRANSYLLDEMNNPCHTFYAENMIGEIDGIGLDMSDESLQNLVHKMIHQYHQKKSKKR